MKIRYLIRDALKELYWRGKPVKEGDSSFTMYPRLAAKYTTYEEAEAVLVSEIPNGVYMIDKMHVKL